MADFKPFEPLDRTQDYSNKLTPATIEALRDRMEADMAAIEAELSKKIEDYLFGEAALRERAQVQVHMPKASEVSEADKARRNIPGITFSAQLAGPVQEADLRRRAPVYSLPMTEPILQFFAYAHLPPELQAVSKPFCDLAELIVDALPRNTERTVALRKLLESKDAAVRAKLFIG